MITLESLYVAMLRTRKNKRSSADSVEFELHWEWNLLKIKDDIDNHTFRPTAYTFIRRYPRPREVFACCFALRLLHHYLDIRMRPLIEYELTDRTYNNREGYGQYAAVDKVIEDMYDVSCGYTRSAYYIQMDLQGYFPNASQDYAFSILEDLMKRRYNGDDFDELHYILQVSIFSYPTWHCTRRTPIWQWVDIPKGKSLFEKPPGIGGVIGHLIWQNTMNYYLNDLDHWAVDECGLHYVRFVDDIVICTENKAVVLSMLPEFRRRLEAVGCKMHPRKFYCQHWSKGITFLGVHIKIDRIYADNRSLRRAYQTLSTFRLCCRQDKIDSFISSINSYLGLLKGRNEYNNIFKLVAAIPAGWQRYVHFVQERLCLNANEGYRHFEVLARRYHLSDVWLVKGKKNKRKKCKTKPQRQQECRP